MEQFFYKALFQAELRRLMLFVTMKIEVAICINNLHKDFEINVHCLKNHFLIELNTSNATFRII